MAKLVVLSEGLTGKAFELKSDKATVGRLDDNTFAISDQSVSSHHCELTVQGSDVLVKDLNSTNGTFINGEKVTEGKLKPGQILRLGAIEMRLENGQGAAAAAPAPKRQLDQTRVMTGVKPKDFEQGTRQIFTKDSAFAKKSNKTAVIFITVGVVLGVIIIISLVIAMNKMR